MPTFLKLKNGVGSGDEKLKAIIKIGGFIKQEGEGLTECFQRTCRKIR